MYFEEDKLIYLELCVFPKLDIALEQVKYNNIKLIVLV